jgi:hypothetical protein
VLETQERVNVSFLGDLAAKPSQFPHDRVNYRIEVLHKDLKFPMSKGPEEGWFK